VPPILECRELHRSFGDVHAVNGVSFTVAPGETYGLLGPNGAGKTTTISMVAGLLEPDAGEIVVAGRPMSTRSIDAKRSIGLVPQDLAVYPDLTARENLRFFGRLQGMRGDELAGRIDAVLDVIGLADRADDRSETYSGGMKRRLNIGIGLLHEPELLILDEPTVGVDPQSRNAILESVEHLAGSGMAVLYTTHYMEEAERLCDRVAIVDNGVIVAEGTRRELVERIGQHDLVRLTGEGDMSAAARALEAVPAVEKVVEAEQLLEVTVAQAGAVLPAVLAAATGAGMHVTGVAVVEPDLEAVFLRLTGRALRD
jgi:ABC-2 type transport system ATP-binding protein